MNWDWIISAVIIIALVLAIWARISKQTIPELIGDLKDRFTEKKEDVVEMGVDIYE